MQEILPAFNNALEDQIPVDVSFPITNVNRVVGTIVGSEVSKRYGEEGLPEDTITLRFTGSAGQSFGAFVPKGMSLYLTGDVNDYFGKGLSGGKLIVNSTYLAKHIELVKMSLLEMLLYMVRQAAKLILMDVLENVLLFGTVVRMLSLKELVIMAVNI